MWPIFLLYQIVKRKYYFDILYIESEVLFRYFGYLVDDRFHRFGETGITIFFLVTDSFTFCCWESTIVHFVKVQKRWGSCRVFPSFLSHSYRISFSKSVHPVYHFPRWKSGRDYCENGWSTSFPTRFIFLRVTIKLLSSRPVDYLPSSL